MFYIKVLFQSIFLIIFFLWPALLNGGALFFFDSFAYFEVASSAIKAVTGFSLDALSAAPDATAVTIPQELDGAQSALETKEPYAGRSVYYGAVIGVLGVLFGPWGIVIAQTVLLVLALYLFLASFDHFSKMQTALILTGLALLTALPFYTAYIMPDFLTGLTVLAVLRLALPFKKLTGLEGLFWFGLLTFSLLSHTSHSLLAFGLLLCLAVFYPFIKGMIKVKTALLIPLSLVFAFAGETAFTLAVKKVYGTEPLRPPFIAARMIDDGPGHQYLKENCSEAGFSYCDYLDRLPQYSDDFLWDLNPETGVYQVASHETKVQMSKEQFAFALEVIKHYPVEQLTASLTRFYEQLTRLDLDEFLYTDDLRESIAKLGPESWVSGIAETRFYKDTFDLTLPTLTQKVVFLISLIFFFVLLIGKSSNRSREQHYLFLYGSFILLAILGNAAITGILSTPHDRYQVRIIWLLPFISLALFQSLSLFQKAESPRSIS